MLQWRQNLRSLSKQQRHKLIKGPFQLTFLCLPITALSFFLLLLFNVSAWGVLCSIISSYFLVFTYSLWKLRNNYFNRVHHLTNMFFLRFLKMLLLGFRYFWLARYNYLIAQSKKYLYWLLIHFFRLWLYIDAHSWNILHITLANKEKNARTTVTWFASTNSTVHVSGLRFSWN